MRRVLALILAAAIISSFTFAAGGCASGKIKKINLYRATFNLTVPDEEQVRKVQKAVNDYIGDKIGVEIVLHDISSDIYPETADKALRDGEADLVWTASWETVIGTNDLVSNALVYDFTDLLVGSRVYDSMETDPWEVTKYDGRNYFIPVYKDNAEGYDLMFRKELVDKYGWDLSAVNTLADIENMLEDCKREGLEYPFLLQRRAMFNRFYLDDFDFFTGDPTSDFVAVDRETDTVVNTVESEHFHEFCTLIADWTERGYISETESAPTAPAVKMSAMDWGISWWTDIPVNEEADQRYNTTVAMKTITDRWAHSTSALGSCYCINASCDPETVRACLDFLGLLYTDSYLADIYTFGIEGEDFRYDVNGQVMQESDRYNHSAWESASATVVTPLRGEPSNKASLYREFNSGARISSAAGFRPDISSVESSFAACRKVAEEYGKKLELGGVSPSEVDACLEEYEKALYAAGFEEVLNEFSRQYEDWKSFKH